MCETPQESEEAAVEIVVGEEGWEGEGKEEEEGEGEVEALKREEEEEGEVVPGADAVAEPAAVVVEAGDAAVAGVAVLGAQRHTLETARRTITMTEPVTDGGAVVVA